MLSQELLNKDKAYLYQFKCIFHTEFKYGPFIKFFWKLLQTFIRVACRYNLNEKKANI